ncbi:MAG: sigma-54-dependent Fis family transcriptional regulator [Acidobacteria bacterium]|nr:sigma-54-dependent Fis family transcriptional regulator [Acidobacteriota bacterium]
MASSIILIAEDEFTARSALCGLLESEGYQVLTAEEGEGALRLALERRPDVMLLDVRMPRLDGLSVLKRLRDAGSDTSTVVMTAYGTSATAIEAMKAGAFDYLTKPVDADQLLRVIQRTLALRALRGQVGRLREQSHAPLVGESPSMQQVYKLIGQYALSDATVLIRGESGTGKELVVNAIHEHSARSRAPLVKINCASIPESLLESELFGHEKGAFTNALNQRIGRFEEADGGSLFLDEIGDLRPALQAKLLRALQERTIERLGSNKPIHVDIRLMAATARDLEKEVAEGRFREDLYYRLNVLAIGLPPLRERKADIPALVEHFLRRASRPLSIAPAALEVLCSYDWPGNVRELENVVERGIVLAHGGIIGVEQIQFGAAPAAGRASWVNLVPAGEKLETAVEALERAMIERALRESGGNKTKAADLLGIHRRLLYEKLRRYGFQE